MIRTGVLFVALLAGTGPTCADCFEAAKAYGAIMRASLICNFPEQPALLKAGRLMTESCPSPDSARPGITSGFGLFERERKAKGELEACARWADFINLLSGPKGRR